MKMCEGKPKMGYDEYMKMADADYMKMVGEYSTPKMDDEYEEPESKMTGKLGSQALRAAYTKMSELNDELKNALNFTEHAGVNKMLEETTLKMADMADLIKASHAEHYPDGEQIGQVAKMEDLKKEDEDAQDQLKSFLASGEGARGKFRSLLDDFNDLAGRMKSTPRSRRVISGLQDIVMEATVEANTPKAKSAAEIELDDLRSKVKAAEAKLADKMPAPRP